MKRDNQYFKWGVTAFLVILCSLLSYFVIFHLQNFTSGIHRILTIMMPVIDGIVLSYLLTPLLNFIEIKMVIPFMKLIHYPKKKHKRLYSLLLTYILVFLLVYGFFATVIPQLLNSIQAIIYQFPTYVDQIEIWASKLLENNPTINNTVNNIMEQYSDITTKLFNDKILPRLNELIMSVSMSVYTIIKNTFNLIIGFIISVYLLTGKERFAAHAKKVVYAVRSTESANRVISNFRFSSKTFSSFFIGKIVDSIIIGILCFIITSIIGTPYPVLISVIIGVTNIIPFFGPFLGAIPSLLLILMIDPMQALYFLIFVIILQQVDGNIIGPKILGSSTGLSGFWVIFAITLFGGLFGIFGMIIGVPIFAVFFAAMKSLVESKLEGKKLPTETAKYLHLLYIDAEDDNQMIQMNEENPEPFEGITKIMIRGQTILKSFDHGKNKDEDTNISKDDSRKDKD